MIASDPFQPTSAPTAQPISLAEMAELLVDKALADPEFKQSLCQDPHGVWQQTFEAEELECVQVTVLEEGNKDLYLVIPAGDEDLKQTLVTRPQTIWQQAFGSSRLQGYTVRVVEETADQLYLVLPTDDRGNPPFLQRLGQRIRNWFQRPETDETDLQ